MKKGFSLFSFSENTNISEIIPLIAQAGYDGVEPVLGESGYLTCESSDDEIIKIRNMAMELGLEIPSVGVWSLWANNLVSNDIDVREKAKKIVRFQLRAARLMGADSILVVPGYVGTEFVSDSETVRYDFAYNRAVEIFRELSIDAEREGVVIGIENVWNRFLLSPMEMAALIDDVGSRWVKAYLDVGNVIYTGYPEQWIEILGKRICKVHLSDYRYGGAGLSAFVDLFAGDVDFHAVARALAAIGYDDWLTLEMLPSYKQFPDMAIFSNKPAVDRICELCVRHTDTLTE